MGLLLLFLFLLTLGYLGYFMLPGSRRADAHSLGRLVTSGYLLLSCGAIGLLFATYLAFPGAQVHKLVRYIEFRGVSVTVPSIAGDTSNVRITSNVVDNESEVKRAFRWFAMPAGSWLDLRPDQTAGMTIKSYRVEAHQCPEVVRLNRISASMRRLVAGYAQDRKPNSRSFASLCDLGVDCLRRRLENRSILR